MTEPEYKNLIRRFPKLHHDGVLVDWCSMGREEKEIVAGVDYQVAVSRFVYLLMMDASFCTAHVLDDTNERNCWSQ